jgi:CRP-like cAMP-binding protein
MVSDLILSNFSEHVQLNETEKEQLLSVLIARPFKRGELIVKGGDMAKYMLFANQGYLMTYYTDSNGTDHVISFAGAGWWAADIYSSVSQQTTPYYTKALTDGEALLLPRLAMAHLLQSSPAFERYFRIVFQKGMLRQQRRYIEACSTSAEERYRSFIAAYPDIIAEVQQKYVASYLGITPEFLSKIRGKLVRTA